MKRKVEISYPNITSIGGVYANFLIHSAYSKQLSRNFRSILRGNSIAGDENLLPVLKSIHTMLFYSL